jgi:hypothetical protein
VRFPTHLLALGFLLTTVLATGVSATGIVVDFGPIYTTRGDPAGFVPQPPYPYTGVANIVGFDTQVNDYIRGSGALISGPAGDFILTAAHVVDTLDLVNHNINIGFNVDPTKPPGNPPSNFVWTTAAATYVYPGWDGQHTLGNDIALIKLAGPAPVGAQRYEIYRGSDEVGAIGEKVGYGMSGPGEGGISGPYSLASGTQHAGQNRYDALADIFGDIFTANIPELARPLAGTQLAYDFDDGTLDHDAFGFLFGGAYPAFLQYASVPALLGVTDEVMAAPGDSGGPTFIDGRIAGVTSYALRITFVDPPGTSDINNLLDSSYGEFAVDTRVSYYAGWIDSVIPEPVTLVGVLLGMGALARYIRRRQA